MIKTKEMFDVRFIDASRLAAVGRCETMFLFRCLMGLRNAEGDTLNLDYGTIMHRILPFMFSGDTKKPIELFNELWKKFRYGEEDLKRNTALSIRRIMDFVNSHSPENCPYQITKFEFSSPAELISENEIPFLIDIGALYPYCGRIDAAIRWKADMKLWGQEFKTSSELSPRYFDGFWFSPQAVGYTLALSQIIDEMIEGLMYEGMRISKTNIESQIGFVHVNETNIRKFVDEAKLTCARISIANERGEWRQNHSLCSSYASFGFPCRACEYKMLCDSPDWRDSIKFYKRVEPFDPLKIKE